MSMASTKAMVLDDKKQMLGNQSWSLNISVYLLDCYSLLQFSISIDTPIEAVLNSGGGGGGGGGRGEVPMYLVVC